MKYTVIATQVETDTIRTYIDQDPAALLDFIPEFVGVFPSLASAGAACAVKAAETFGREIREFADLAKVVLTTANDQTADRQYRSESEDFIITRTATMQTVMKNTLPAQFTVEYASEDLDETGSGLVLQLTIRPMN